MKHIQTLNTRDMAKSLNNGGCGECQTSCQSACKTSCGASPTSPARRSKPFFASIAGTPPCAARGLFRYFFAPRQGLRASALLIYPIHISTPPDSRPGRARGRL